MGMICEYYLIHLTNLLLLDSPHLLDNVVEVELLAQSHIICNFLIWDNFTSK